MVSIVSRQLLAIGPTGSESENNGGVHIWKSTIRNKQTRRVTTPRQSTRTDPHTTNLAEYRQPETSIKQKPLHLNARFLHPRHRSPHTCNPFDYTGPTHDSSCCDEEFATCQEYEYDSDRCESILYLGFAGLSIAVPQSRCKCTRLRRTRL